MRDERPDLFRLMVPCDTDAPFAVREAIEHCEALSRVRADAKLIASELVTNAVIHSGCDRADMLDIRASLRDGHCLIAVTDPFARGGFGLRVVQALADRWGSERRNGQRVWAEVPL